MNSIPSMSLSSNVVTKEALREVQLSVMKQLRGIMAHTFGPAGSNTMMLRGTTPKDLVSSYSKDGHTVLNNIVYQNPIEMSIQSELTDVTRYVEKKVGDGTTSAIELSSFIFEKLCSMEESNNPYRMMREFHSAVDMIKERIKSHKRDITLEDIYNISLISTNGNAEVAQTLSDIYEEQGFDVFIDVKISNDENIKRKTYDGLTFQEGYCSRAYINTHEGIVRLRSPRVYAFSDPIDTPEMISLFTNILNENIYKPMRERKGFNSILIMTPKISRDAQSIMEELEESLYQYDARKSVTEKPEICIITNFSSADELDQFNDIARVCGAPMIRKYIDPKIQKQDIEDGKAPSAETVVNFYGTSDLVEVDDAKAKFINPKLMHDENGNLGPVYNSIIAFTESELKNCQERNEDITTIARLKRKLNQLKANMVDYFVGGITISDRDSLRALVEDAVLNCRSAAINGVGYAANFEGYRSVSDLKNETDKEDSLYKYYDLIESAYKEVSLLLYSTMYADGECESIITQSLILDCPMNLSNGEYDYKVLTSIDTDVIILDAISRIITIMFTANQALVQAPSLNIYS